MVHRWREQGHTVSLLDSVKYLWEIVLGEVEGLDEWEVVVVVVVMVYDEWACVTRWVESEFDDVGGSQNDDIALEVACELVAKEVVVVVEGEVPWIKAQA